MERQSIEDMLENPYHGYWERMREEFRGQDTRIELATPEGIIEIIGKFAYGTYPKRITLSHLSEKSMKALEPITTQEGKFNRSVKWTKYGLLYRGNDTNDLGTTVRAQFFDEDHAILSIKMEKDLIYKSPIVPERYGPFSRSAQFDFRNQHNFPISAGI